MSVRFVIRKDGPDSHPWAFRDAKCANAEHHDFIRRGWGDECWGSCDSFTSHPEAVNQLKWATP